MIGMTMSFRCPHLFHGFGSPPSRSYVARYLVTGSVTWVSERGALVTPDSGDFSSKQAFICLFKLLNVLAKRASQLSDPGQGVVFCLVECGT